jgi:hypothetical protein
MDDVQKQAEIKLYDEFMLPVTVRIVGTIFTVCGLIAMTKIFFVGLVLAPIGLLAWGIRVKGVFYPGKRELLAETTLFGIRVSGGQKKIEISHISITRTILSTTIQVAPVKGFAGPGITLDNYQYNVYLVFDKNKKETLHSVSDDKEAMDFAFRYARDFGVKIFYAASTPQKWIDPITGIETVVEFKKKR